MEAAETEVRSKITQVFRFLQALDQIKNPVIKNVKDQLWFRWLYDLPKHECIYIAPVVDDSDIKDNLEEIENSDEDDLILRVRRPDNVPVPTPYEEFITFLDGGWDNCNLLVSIHQIKKVDEDGNEAIFNLEDDPERLKLFNDWLSRRNEWAEEQKIVQKVQNVFQDIYDLYSRIQRESEQVELVLGDGILNWPQINGSIINHPLIVQRIELRFNSAVPEFVFTESDKGPELYSALLRSISNVSPIVIATSIKQVDEQGIHPLAGRVTSEFLAALAPQINAKGEYVRDKLPVGKQDIPRIGRAGVIFLRRRNLGFSLAIESILGELPEVDVKNIPDIIPRAIGVTTIPSLSNETKTIALDPNGEDEEVLFSKEANGEQLQIVKYVNMNGAGLVQGPPGTGKTHTIANLIGHFLAQGKTILVTSQSSKALQVLRDKVVPPLQPLCVSVLSDDNRKEIESSINDITERLSFSNAEVLETEANSLRSKRLNLLQELRKLRSDLKAARLSEYTAIVIAGQEYTPIDAAKVVADGKNINDWIPSPVSEGEPCPISEAECRELYRLNFLLCIDEEKDLANSLPSMEGLLKPEDFVTLVETKKILENTDLNQGEQYWTITNEEVNYEQLLVDFDAVKNCIINIMNKPKWLQTIAVAGMNTQEKEVWLNLILLVENTCKLALKNKELLLEYDVKLPDGKNLEEVQHVLEEIVDYVSTSGGLGKLKLLLKPQWKDILKECSVNGYKPTTSLHFQALKAAADLQLARRRLLQRWKRQVSPIEGPISDNDVNNPESEYLQYCKEINNSLNWFDSSWLPALKNLIDQGLLWDQVLGQVTRNDGLIEQYNITIMEVLPSLITAKVNRIKYQYCLRNLNQLIVTAENLSKNNDVVASLCTTVHNLDAQLYENYYNYLQHLCEKSSVYHKRNELLAKVESVAPFWADSIHSKSGIHGKDTPPGNVIDGWTWIQLNEELSRRSQLSITEIQNTINKISDELRFTTAKLVEAMAWAEQVRRVDDEQRRALQGWKMTMKRIGKGTGVRAPMLKAEARKLMPICQTAVPVWIMPLARVVDNFNPSTNKFDVVIIDEASQADLMALIAMYMGKQIIVVGDDEQVSPVGVGQRLDDVQGLIKSMLEGISNSHLYDSRFSIYDLAMTVLQPICLREHFRCVPEIINFSNWLSYNWKIKPLRDTSSVVLKPHIVDYRVEGALCKRKSNEEEALVIVSLLVACIQQPEYVGATFGVISLLGEEQAYLIDSMLRKYLGPAEYTDRKIQCGNSAHFQGDERDVVFLSMVDTCDGDGPLTFRSEEGHDKMYKKRYNVASSRARDQLWVVYSLNPVTDLKEGDLRRKLIQYAKDPYSISRELDSVLVKTESDFEKQVAQKLVQAGYKVIPQWKVGSYRIDMVVEGNDKRLAVECDGDKYHTLDNLQEDMNRQAILERLGWHFVRIRGSEFYRDPDGAMTTVFLKLEDMGIHPQNPISEDETVHECELLDRVKRVAAELRETWKSSETDTNIVPISINLKKSKKNQVTINKLEREEEIVVNDDAASNVLSESKMTSLKVQSDAHQEKDETKQFFESVLPFDIKESTYHDSDVISILREEGLSFVDKRDKNGALWVMGGKELAPVMRRLNQEGFQFKFTQKGGRATKHQPAWYCK